MGSIRSVLLCIGSALEDAGKWDQLYNLIYATYIGPVERKHADLIDMLHVSSRTYYRLRTEAISIMSIRLWSAPSGNIDDWLEVLTLMESIFLLVRL